MIREKQYTKVRSIEEAIQLAAIKSNNSKFIAGGTDLMVNKFQGNEDATHLIDITDLEELKGIRRDEKFLYIGALTKLDELKNSKEIRSEFSALIKASESVGSPLIRKTATLGGNILCENRCIYYNQSEWWREAAGFCLKCNGDICIATGGKKACFSEFVSDTAPVLIAMQAKIRIIEEGSETLIPLEDLYTGDGVHPTKMTRTSILKEILLPLNQSFTCFFQKLRQRDTLEFAALTTAVCLNKIGQLRIVLGAVDPKPILVEGGPDDQRTSLIKKALKGARAVENDMFSRNYRREMIQVFLNKSFDEINFK